MITLDLLCLSDHKESRFARISHSHRTQQSVAQLKDAALI